MQESRLFKIVYHLLDKGHATASELAEKFEVSKRTIYRDLDALSGAGVPVYTETGRNGGIYLINSFVLNKAILSETEKLEILAALQSLNAVRSTDTDGTLEKLSALFHTEAQDWIEVDFSRWGGNSKTVDNEKFVSLKSAVINHKCVKITYAGSSENIGERVIHPIKLMYKAKSWYLKAFCIKKQEYRIFKLTRILDFEILNENFAPHRFPEPKGTMPLTENEIITLRFPQEAAYRVYDEFTEDEVNRQGNGDLIVKTDMPQDTWLVGYLLSFGTQVEIVEPEHLRRTLAEKAKEIFEYHNY